MSPIKTVLTRIISIVRVRFSLSNEGALSSHDDAIKRPSLSAKQWRGNGLSDRIPRHLMTVSWSPVVTASQEGEGRILSGFIF